MSSDGSFSDSSQTSFHKAPDRRSKFLLRPQKWPQNDPNLKLPNQKLLRRNFDWTDRTRSEHFRPKIFQFLKMFVEAKTFVTLEKLVSVAIGSTHRNFN